MLLFIWLLLLNPVQAQVAVERLCFPTDAQAQRALPIVEVVLVKGQDRAELDGRCMNVTCDMKRTEVLRRWIKTRLPQAESTFSSIDIPELECDMLATKKTQKQKDQTQVQVDGQNFQVSTGENKQEQLEEHRLKVTSGGTATLIMGTTELKITCTASPSGIYRLKFSQRYLAPPPVVVNGTIVRTTENEAATSLSSELEARKDTPINLGQISRELTNKDKEIGISTGLSYENTGGNEVIDWSLVIH